MFMKKIYLRILCSTAGLLPAATLPAQNAAAPYSILGIGDVDTKDYGRYAASGSAALSRRDASTFNFFNPAALTALPYKMVNFDAAMRGRSSRFGYPDADTFTISSRDYVVKQVSLAFKPGEKTGFAFGLRQYSSVSYLVLSEQKILDGSSSYTKISDGSGGINQFYFSAGRQLGSRLSAGITASYLFGSLKRQTNYLGNSIGLNLQRAETDFYTGAKLLAGLQYYTPTGKKWQHLLGVTASASTRLRGFLTTEYSEFQNIIRSEEETGRSFKMPYTAGLGYTAILKNKLSFSAEAVYSGWPYQKLNYSRSYTGPSTRISLGMEYSKKIKQQNGDAEKKWLGMGFTAGNAYSWIRNQPLWSYSVTAGGGLNLSRSITVYGSIEKGVRGNKNAGQIKENFTQVILGLTLKDIWLGPKFTRRYQ
jgi:hypothetical protein